MGYINKGLTEIGGTKLVSASFTEIGAEGIQMANLKPQGYLNHADFMTEDFCGTHGDFVITYLDEGGEMIGQYSWDHDFDFYGTGRWADEGHWLELYNDREPGYFDVVPVGVSMFFTSPTPDDGEKFELPNSGEVITKKFDYELPEGTCQWGNPRATVISIFDLVPSGYLDNQTFLSEDYCGTHGDFVITYLDEGGEMVGQYAWDHDFDFYGTQKWADEGSWTELVPAESTDLQPGDGVFVTGAYHDGDEGTPYIITLPKQDI